MNSRARLFTLANAFSANPELTHIAQRVQQSQQMLALIKTLVPREWHNSLQAGPVDTESWCILVNNPGISGKLRQLTPQLLTQLQRAGYSVPHLRIKMHSAV